MFKLDEASVAIALITSLALTPSAGCGGDGGGNAAATCAKTAACGGVATGTWNVAGGCMDEATLTQVFAAQLNCPNAKVSAELSQSSGTLTFNADATYGTAVRYTASVSVSLPDSCLVLNGVPLPCAFLGPFIQSSGGSQLSLMSVSCQARASQCDCKIVQAPQSRNESGTYTVSGNTISTLSSTGATNNADYCVKGNTLTLLDVNAPMTGGALAGTALGVKLVATKKK